MFLDVGFYGNEVLMDELRGFGVFIRLSIQPSACASRGGGAEVQQGRLALVLRLRQRLVDVLAPIHGHWASLHLVIRMREEQLILASLEHQFATYSADSADDLRLKAKS
jgi:hypothetical protein